MKARDIIGRIVYGSVFVIALPLALILLAHFTRNAIRLPVPGNPWLNGSITVVGALFIVVGMINLWQFGKGLPMNAYPPMRFVTKGLYAICRNPIYVGAILLSFGVSALLQSASGFWLVSPMLMTMVVAYLVGFENERTEKVFGRQDYSPFLSLPEHSDDSATAKEKTASFLLAGATWLLVYEAFIFLGNPIDAIPTNTYVDSLIPLIGWSVIFYMLTYVFAVMAPFILETKGQLRSFVLDVQLATAISALLYFSLPFVVNQTQVASTTFWNRLIMLDRSYDGMSAAFPAFHVIWAFIAARCFSKPFFRTTLMWYSLAVLISISCVTTGNHTVADVGAGIIVTIIVFQKEAIWNAIRKLSERLANSWKEWNIGSVRIINHGFYAGAAAFAGTWVIGSVLGDQYAFDGFIIGLCAIVGAALWAQLIEGSPRLQRPYGYYGSVAGVFIGSAIIVLFSNVSFVFLSASVALAAPWIQILGRLRCLVQGCCHGKPTEEWLGIRFTHPYSRVNKISGLQGTCLHPTQLYSIGNNLVSGIILIRLYSLDMSATFILGMYLFLNALGRFVEEHYRGEAQTPYWMGMRIYQWLAVFFIITGATCMCLPSSGLPNFQPNNAAMTWAMVAGLLSIVAYGVDFPNSTRRFARLTTH